MFWKKRNEFRLQVGEHTIGLETPSAKYVVSLEEYFNVPSAATRNDISLKLSLVEHSDEIFVPDSMFVNKRIDGEQIVFGDDIARCVFSDRKGRGELLVKTALTHGPVTRVFEQILYQAFYSVCRKKKAQDFLIHSSGVIYKEKGFLFVGSSGSGKSTAAKNSSDYCILNDEICLLTKHKGKFQLNGTPFNGYFREKRPGHAPLAAVLLLAHGPENRFKKVKKSEAIKRIAKEIVPTVGLTELLSPANFGVLLDYSSDIYDTVPVYEMEFLPDKSFWQLIDREFCEN